MNCTCRLFSVASPRFFFASLPLGCNYLVMQLMELDKAISKAEREPSRFSLTVEELRQRRSWVENAREEVGWYLVVL